MTPETHHAEVEAWHAARMAALRDDTGWLHITDRTPLELGPQTVGRGAENQLVLRAGPAHLGVVTLNADGSVTLQGNEGLRAFPTDTAPSMLRSGDLLLEISRLEGETALRVRDLSDRKRFDYPVIGRFPLAAEWDIDAAWEALPEARTLGITTIVGVPTSVQLTHQARFIHEGQEIVLLATHWRNGQPMFLLRDATSGHETYGAARFLIGEIKGDRVRLDFNKAFNPPCSFTDHAVCPMPPAANRLSIAVRAGELAPPPRG